ncbi:MAG: hypothetical protein QM538_02165 [Methylacidiphilales bacterium]|nr:hypothetical protein [Candidatus Methylacidiphilales bacterium]
MVFKYLFFILALYGSFLWGTTTYLIENEYLDKNLPEFELREAHLLLANIDVKQFIDIHSDYVIFEHDKFSTRNNTVLTATKNTKIQFSILTEDFILDINEKKGYSRKPSTITISDITIDANKLQIDFQDTDHFKIDAQQVKTSNEY